MQPENSLKLSEICQLINGKLDGDGDTRITGIDRLDEAGPGQLTFVASAKHAKQISQIQASALIVYPDFPETDKNVIRVDEPYSAFLTVAKRFLPHRKPVFPGIHHTVILGEDTLIGENPTLGPYVVIGRDCTIGNNVSIESGVVISDGVQIGDDTVIHQNVSIREDCRIGNRVILHPGVVIGADGFGFQNVAGSNQKIPQIGIVIIEDDVEIGANSTIDRAAVGATRIGRGSKLDNLIQIGHNVVIGEQTVIASQTGVSGSTKIGRGVIIAGQVGIADHLTIGDRAILGAQCGVTKSIPAGVIVSGYPARAHMRAKREEAVIRRLPELLKLINSLKERVTELELDEK